MNFWYVNVAGTEPKNDKWDLEQAPRRAELEHRPQEFGSRSWADLTAEEKDEQIRETKVPIVHLLAVAHGARCDPTELVAYDASVFQSKYLDMLEREAPTPAPDPQLKRLAQQVEIIAREMTYGDAVFTWLGGDQFRIASVVGDYRFDESSRNIAPHQIPIFWSDKIFSNSDAAGALSDAENSTDWLTPVAQLTLEQVRPLLYQGFVYQWAHSR